MSLVLVAKRLPKDPIIALRTLEKLNNKNIQYNVSTDFLIISLEDYIREGPFWGHFTDRLYTRTREKNIKSTIKIRKTSKNTLRVYHGKFCMTVFIPLSQVNFSWDNYDSELFWKLYFGISM